MVSRTRLGTFLQNGLSYFLHKKYEVYVHGLDTLKHAWDSYKSVLVLASHTSSDDIVGADYAIRAADLPFPVFVLRDTLRIPPFSRALSQRVMTEHCKGIALDQKESKPQVMEEILSAYAENHPVVLFPGATREAGYLNDLVSGSVGLFYLFHEKQKEICSHHAYVPLGIRYLDDVMVLSFGDPVSHALLSEQRTSSREVGRRIHASILELSTHPAGEVRAYIQGRE